MLWSDKNPLIPGFVRGLLLALIGAALAFITDWQTTDGLPGWVIAAVPMAVLAMRALEALVLDTFRDKADRMTPDL